MLKDFDNAFLNKIKTWYSNTIFANTAIVYNVAFNLVEDPTVKLTFPLVSIYRPSGFSLADMQSFAARKRGIEFYTDPQTNTTTTARFLVVNLAYQIDIYAKYPEKLMDITENIMQGLNFSQKLEVTQHDESSGQDFVESYDITYNNGPIENSEFQSDDRVYHYSLVYEIKNARLLNFKNLPTIEEIIAGELVDGVEI